MMLVFVPWMEILYYQIRAVKSGFWIDPPNLMTLAETIIEFAGSFSAAAVILPLCVLAVVHVRKRLVTIQDDNAQGKPESALIANVQFDYCLALLLLWPQNTVPQNPLPPTTMPATQRPKGPAKLTVRALPGSRVSIDFVDIGVVPGSGEVQHELTSATGAPEWSVSIHVTKNGFEEFVTRQTIRAGQNALIQASQSSLSGGSSRSNK